MLHIELPYASRIGTYLKNFKQKSQYLWNFSCPICGDMSKGKQKARAYIYRPGGANHLNVKCHHCGHSSSLGSFLKLQFPAIYKEFAYERYKATNVPHVPHTDFLDKEKVKVDAPLTDAAVDDLLRCDKLPSTHEVVELLRHRKIPMDRWHLLYYTPSFVKYTNNLLPGKIKDMEEHPRLIIPYFDNHGKMFAYSARALDDHPLRYFTIKLDDRERVYGLDRINNKLGKIYAVEGPLDSLFLPNCIAVSGSNFDCDTTRALKSVLTLIPDNEPRSREVCKLINKHIKLGYRVCLLPHRIKTKDINEHIMSGMSKEELIDLIDSNTFQGATAMLRFSHWNLVEKQQRKTYGTKEASFAY